ncbi:MAG: glycosyltransferase family 2 protein [Paraprevotella sp.]|nr:glycosyltransferase family 2 protein [Paraprevotella sp.]
MILKRKRASSSAIGFTKFMKYTVAIPAYKSDFLKECIESILNQTFQDFELIIVDDASPQPIREIVAAFDDPRISYYRNATNSGSIDVVDNWNRCLSLAKGEYFCLMGDDDIMDKEYLSEMDRLSRQYPEIDVFHGRTMEINEHSQITKIYQAWPTRQSVYDLIWHRIARLRVTFISDFTFKTQILKQDGGFYKLPLAWGSDDISVYQAASSHGIAATNKVVFYYRRHSTSITSSGSTEIKLQAILKEEQWLKNFVASHHPSDETDKVLCRMISSSLQPHINYRKSLEICQAWRKRKYVSILRLLGKGKRYGIGFKTIARGILMAWGN